MYIACPLDTNVVNTTGKEKINKYQILCVDMQRTWQLVGTRILPIVISVNGLVNENIKMSLQQLDLPVGLIGQMKRATILQTGHIMQTQPGNREL